MTESEFLKFINDFTITDNSKKLYDAMNDIRSVMYEKRQVENNG